MSIEEKVMLLSGKNVFETHEIFWLGRPSIFCADEPHGLRKQIESGNHLGIAYSCAAICFPTVVTIANSWNEELGEKLEIH